MYSINIFTYFKQNGSFDEQSTLEEIVNKWTSLKESGTHDVKSQPDDSLSNNYINLNFDRSI